MASRLNPYLHFTGQAREALEFYGEVFGGTPVFSTYGDLGQSGDDADLVMHGQLETDRGFTLMASDAPASMRDETSGEASTAVSISLSGDDPDLRAYWDKLSADGNVTMPLEKQAWGDEFGMCVDRFGMEWLVNISPAAA